VPANFRLHPSEVAYLVDNSRAAALFCDETFSPPPPAPGVRVLSALELPSGTPLEAVDVAPEEAAWLFYTSGTTGRPKGAELSHRVVLAGTMNCLADIWSYQPEDVVLHAAPLTHGSGFYMLPGLARGSLQLVSDQPSFEPARFFELIEREKVSAIAFLAPTMIVKLLNDSALRRHDLSSLQHVCYGGGPMYSENIKEAVEALGRVWVQIYAQGETPMTATYLRAAEHRWDDADAERRLSSVGIARTDVEVRVLDDNDAEVPAGEVGQLCVRAETVMMGYWDDSGATAETLRGGWLHTGDLGYRDQGGYFFLVDRAKDMIISAGNNIYAREVEEALLTHPAVLEVAVIGRPDAYWGESVHAVVVLRSGAIAGERELIDHVRGQIASYKKPKTIDFVAELPKNSYGKVLKTALRGDL
jgi:acyl-CoA synthetase (AMP-forming)/AMP-acid ligase II